MSHWADYLPPRKPFYRRPWFATVLLVLVIGAAVAGAFLWSEIARWDHKAQAFDYAKLTAMESASIIYDRNNQVIGRILIQNRDTVPFDKLSPNLIKAVIGAEDARFYQHHGVDYYGIGRAMVVNYRSGRTRQGASTLTQQLARNTFPDELPSNDRSYGRKLLEMAVAKEIENRCDKQTILNLYLNRVFFGSGFYGAEAAARGYFGKHASEVDLSEAATLAGLLRSPNNLSPWRNREACVEQRNRVLQRLLELKMITKSEYDTTILEDLVVKNRHPFQQESYAAEFVSQQVKKLVGDEGAVSEGYRIYTTIDGTIQKAAEDSLKQQLERVEHHEGFSHQTYSQFDQIFRAYKRKFASEGDTAAGPQPEPEYLQGSSVVLDNETGGILALVGGRDVAHSEFDRAISARCPAGTAFMPIVYAAGFEKGSFPGTLVQDAVLDNRQVMIGGTTGILGEWGPERLDNKFEGWISARTALVKSKNAAAVRFGMTVGLDAVSKLSKAAGIESPLRQYPSTYLGSSEVTLLEMTLANTMFPNGGWRPTQPFIIERIVEKDGRTIFQFKPEKTRVIKATTAYEVHSCLADVLERGTGDKTFTDYALKRYPLGGKTGTAYNFTDLWFVGYSSEVTCGVWVGFDKRAPIYRGAFSNEIALPVWVDVMKTTFAGYKPKEIPSPKGMIKCEICSASGLLATAKCAEAGTVYSEICTEAQAPKDGCDVHGGPRLSRPLTGPAVRPNSMGAPRPEIVVDQSAHTLVALKGPTVIGEDPYHSEKAAGDLQKMADLKGQSAPLDSSKEIPKPTAAAEPEVRRPQRVGAGAVEQANTGESVIKLDPPAPLKF